jgi:hypothetical protein
MICWGAVAMSSISFLCALRTRLIWTSGLFIADKGKLLQNSRLSVKTLEKIKALNFELGQEEVMLRSAGVT